MKIKSIVTLYRYICTNRTNAAVEERQEDGNKTREALEDWQVRLG